MLATNPPAAADIFRPQHIHRTHFATKWQILDTLDTHDFENGIVIFSTKKVRRIGTLSSRQRTGWIERSSQGLRYL